MTRCQRRCAWVDLAHEEHLGLVIRLYLHESWGTPRSCWLEVEP